MELGAVAVEHGEVERSEVGVEVLVDELVVDGEVVRVGRRLWPHGRLEGDKYNYKGNTNLYGDNNLYGDDDIYGDNHLYGYNYLYIP